MSEILSVRRKGMYPSKANRVFACFKAFKSTV